MNNKLLPIGSVVTLEGAEKKVNDSWRIAGTRR